MRKRQTFKDLMMLAVDTSGRRAELFVIGPEPCRFLATSTSTAAWALDCTGRAPNLHPPTKQIACRTHAVGLARQAPWFAVRHAVMDPEAVLRIARNVCLVPGYIT